jgi:hypothetical protein
LNMRIPKSQAPSNPGVECVPPPRTEQGQNNRPYLQLRESFPRAAPVSQQHGFKMTIMSRRIAGYHAAGTPGVPDVCQFAGSRFFTT